MKTTLLSLLVVGAGCSTLAAQTQVAAPSTPAPAVETVTAPAAPAASQFVYTPRLPTAAELTNVASAQGLTIDKIVQTDSQMTVVYRSANGQTNTVAYMLLPASGTPVGTSGTVVTTAPAPRVVYTEPAPVYYYDPFYYPAYYGPWYGPVSLSVGWGFGYRGGWHGHGGFHGGHRWR